MGRLSFLKSSSVCRIDAPQSGKLDQTVTLVILPGGTGVARRFTFSRTVLGLGIGAVLAAIGGLSALSVQYFKLRGVSHELAQLQVEHESIRSEAAALYKQLRDVQSNLSQVDSFSNQVREATQLDRTEHAGLKAIEKPLPPDVKKKPILKSADLLDRLSPPPASLSGSLRISSPPLNGIGPVTEEEYEEYLASESRPQNFQVAARVKEESLAFGEIFNELDALQTQSFEQISDLSSLLAEVNAYRVRLAKTPTIAPVEGRLTSHYGYRNSPVSGARRMHQGLDIAAPLGSPIRAAAAGIVTKVSRAPDYGKYVEIAHGHDVVTLYAHTRQILVKAGEQVAKGQLIALVGMTGRTTGPHLHYEIKVKGQRVNPYSYISGF
jgi:murein DD-endopeptidase MepM/ murein hydrolase activator NlpD